MLDWIFKTNLTPVGLDPHELLLKNEQTTVGIIMFAAFSHRK